jgi:hypothetical protein
VRLTCWSGGSTRMTAFLTGFDSSRTFARSALGGSEVGFPDVLAQNAPTAMERMSETPHFERGAQNRQVMRPPALSGRAGVVGGSWIYFFGSAPTPLRGQATRGRGAVKPEGYSRAGAAQGVAPTAQERKVRSLSIQSCAAARLPLHKGPCICRRPWHRGLRADISLRRLAPLPG